MGNNAQGKPQCRNAAMPQRRNAEKAYRAIAGLTGNNQQLAVDGEKSR
ncbi:MAG: hypothetical protein ACREBY_17770 [Polaromonas sp.]